MDFNAESLTQLCVGLCDWKNCVKAYVSGRSEQLNF